MKKNLNDIIYNNKTQIYVICEDDVAYNDNNGGKQQAYHVIDQDYDKVMICLRITPDSTAQLYVDFNDVSWVYNMVRQ